MVFGPISANGDTFICDVIVGEPIHEFANADQFVSSVAVDVAHNYPNV